MDHLASLLERERVDFVDLRAVDLTGRFRRLTVPAERFLADAAGRGIGFDASNYGFRDVSGSDMMLVPDLTTAYVETRAGERVLAVIGDIVEADSRHPAAIDPRGTARRAEAHLRRLGIGDELLVSPEFEFYVFERAVFESEPGGSGVELVPLEGCEHRREARIGTRAGSAYHAPMPQDRLFPLRNSVCRELAAAGIPVRYHHHEVGAFGQAEIELGFGSLLRMADATLIVKHIVRNAAHEAGLSATFMPKPIFGQAGNGMHLHQFLQQGGARNLFTGPDGLSHVALCYIGGLLAHGRSLMALTNPTTNSYRRLLPGYEAPVHLVYGAANRTAAVRVPAYARGDDLRIELRTMDAACNPYLAFAAILMAGLDGIARELDAHRLGYGPVERDAHGGMDAQPELLAPRCLEEALDALAEDHDYLTAGGVFDPDGIGHWIEVKRREAEAVAQRPHPEEFVLYYDL